MPPLYTFQKFLRFPTYKISITLLSFLICLGKKITPSQCKNRKKFRQSLAAEYFFAREMTGCARLIIHRKDTDSGRL